MNAKSTEFQVEVGVERIREYYQLLRDHVEVPKLFFKINDELRNLEWVISNNLSAPMEWELPENSVERRAVAFLRNFHIQLGIKKAIFVRQLYLIHVHRSAMGYHCILGLRNQGQEICETNFVVHLDHNMTVIMLSAVYQQLTRFEYLENFDTDAKLQSALETLMKQFSIISVERCGLIWQPDWKAGVYKQYLRVKISTDVGAYVLLLNNDDKKRTMYSVHVESSHLRTGISNVYSGNWIHQHLAGLRTKPQKAVLRDLTNTKHSLAGKYVEVNDQINLIWSDSPLQIEIFADPSSNSSHFDRVMAYYHIDQIQRYFRELGLTVLDEYPELNPLQVVLYKGSDTFTYYDSQKKTIFFRQIPGATVDEWTEARSPLVVYHEFVHAVTDAIARLSRQNTMDSENPRQLEMIQAAAIDEGLADYFACSMGMQSGQLDPPQIYQLVMVDPDLQKVEFRADEHRSLGEAPDLTIPYRTRRIELPTEDREIRALIYKWGNHWARYLWHLRHTLGPEIADRLIANSIFFLTRWSSFGMGIWALIIADQQLFGGMHKHDIQSIAGMYPFELGPSPTRQDKIAAQLPVGSELAFSIDTGEESAESSSAIPENDKFLDLGQEFSVNAGDVVHNYLRIAPQ